MNDLVRDAPADPAAFMASLARLPAPSPAPVTARTLLRRAKLRRQIALWRRREWYARVPALCMEAAALVTVAISTTCWLGERWGLARGLLGEALHAPARASEPDVGGALRRHRVRGGGLRGARARRLIRADQG